MNSKLVQCKTCGAEIARGAIRCPHCGASAWSRSKMTHCKTCGNDIAKTATVCPHCGAKLHQGTQAACWVIAILTISLWICYLALVRPSLKSPSKTVSNFSELPIESAATDDEESNTVLGPGTYTVGTDIDAGKYDCIAVSGFGVLRGDIASAGPAGFVQTMGSNTASVGGATATVEGAPSYSNLTLEDGDVVYIEMSLNVEFVPK